MALKSTIYKAQLQIADMDRQLYADHALTLALHPSETEERLLVRLLAFALNVPHDTDRGALQFGQNLPGIKRLAHFGPAAGGYGEPFGEKGVRRPDNRNGRRDENDKDHPHRPDAAPDRQTPPRRAQGT